MDGVEPVPPCGPNHSIPAYAGMTSRMPGGTREVNEALLRALFSQVPAITLFQMMTEENRMNE